MSVEKRTLRQRISHWLFAIPAVTQLWARLTTQKSRATDTDPAQIPFTPLGKPLAQCRAALITTGGIHLPTQTPFNMEDADGDASYREIPGDVDLSQLVITHKYYNHESADQDPQVIFPLDHFRDLVNQGIIGSLARNHFGLMGHIEGAQMPQLLNKSAPEIAAKLREDGVDFAFLTPA